MASPEHQTDPAAALAAIELRLEIVDGIENPIERTFKQNALWEQYDELQAEMDTTAPPDDK